MITAQIVDNLIAYKRAIVDTTTAELRKDWDEVASCREEETIRLDGLFAVIQIAINDAASDAPHNPFSINGDVNQPVSIICNNSMTNGPDVQPRSRLQQAMDDDPQIRNEHGSYPPPPRKDS